MHVLMALPPTNDNALPPPLRVNVNGSLLTSGAWFTFTQHTRDFHSLFHSLFVKSPTPMYLHVYRSEHAPPCCRCRVADYACILPLADALHHMHKSAAQRAGDVVLMGTEEKAYAIQLPDDCALLRTLCAEGGSATLRLATLVFCDTYTIEALSAAVAPALREAAVKLRAHRGTGSALPLAAELRRSYIASDTTTQQSALRWAGLQS